MTEYDKTYNRTFSLLIFVITRRLSGFPHLAQYEQRGEGKEIKDLSIFYYTSNLFTHGNEIKVTKTGKVIGWLIFLILFYFCFLEANNRVCAKNEKNNAPNVVHSAPLADYV